MAGALIFAVIALAGALLTLRLAVAAIRSASHNRTRSRVRRIGIEAPATVIANRAAGRGAGSIEAAGVPDRPPRQPRVYYPVLRYLTVSGEEYTAPTREPWPAPFTIGETVAIVYDPDQPADFTPSRGRPGTPTSYLVGLTVLMGLLTLGVAFFAVRLWAVGAGHGFDLPGIDVPGVVLPSNR